MEKPKKNSNKKTKKQGVSYEKIHIKIDYPVPIRKGMCQSCLRKIGNGIKRTSLHHTLYAYHRNTVRKNPYLALHNTIELCYGCHPVADGFRGVLLSSPRGSLRSIPRIIQVLKLLPKEQQDHFTELCKKWLRNKK